MSLEADVVVIGGGAAGLMCAAVAGQRGRRVRLLEHAERVGKKILMSGGGRCNFTNLHVTPANYLSANPHFCKSALARYTPADFIELVTRHGIAYHEKERGQLFCDHSSRQIVDLLVAECRDAEVVIEVGTEVNEVAKVEGGFRIETGSGQLLTESLVVATGGLSIPLMGATDFGYDLARHFGHKVLPTRPGLVPFTFAEPARSLYGSLAGVSLPAVVSCGKRRFDAGLLFTHRGLSGPSILQISSYWQNGETIAVDFFAGRGAREWLRERRRERPAAELKNVLGEVLPKRLAQLLCEVAASTAVPAEGRPLRQYSGEEIEALGARLEAWSFLPDGTEGYRKAEVTLGGVDTNELSQSTLESKKVPGLFFIGEVVDVTGHLGGFNFQWAWASGHAAGEVA